MSVQTQTQRSPSPAHNPQGPGSDLEFVFIEQPSDSRTRDFRRQVRSHVTGLQHRNRRARRREIWGETIGAAVDTGKRSPHVPIPRHRPVHIRPAEQDTPSTIVSNSRREPSSNSSANLRTPENQLVVQGTRQPAQISWPPWSSNRDAIYTYDPNASPWRDVLVWRYSEGTLAHSFSRSSMAFRTFLLHDSDNTVGLSLHRLGFDISNVMSCYDHIVQVQAKNFEEHYLHLGDGVVDRGISYSRYLDFILQDPTLVKIVILITVRILLQSRQRPLNERELYSALQLRGLLISEINAQLADPIRAISGRMFTAVSLLAAHELQFVSVTGYRVHMEGLVRMVNLRGGMSAIGREDPYMERFLVWHDSNTSKQAGCEPYLKTVEDPSKLSRPEANEDMFRMKGAYAPVAPR